MAARGRPSFKWTEEMETEILDRIAGGEALVTICGPERDSFLPSDNTVYKRIANDADFANKYAHAREIQAHREADEIRAIADAATPEDYNVARLRIDARKWRASKLAPKKYGDKLDVEANVGVTVNLPEYIDRI